MRVSNTVDDYDDGNRTARKLRRVVCMATGLEGSRNGMAVPECSSPAKLAICRLLSIVKKCRGGKGLAAMEEREIKLNRQRRREKVLDYSPEKLPENSPENFPANDHVSGCQKQEITFNLAAGLGLLSLIAASKTELDKTMELRREMEGFLRGIKEEHQSTGTTPKPCPSDHGHAYAAVSTTLDGLSYVSHYSYEDHVPSLCQPESGISLVCDDHYNMHEKEVPVDGMNDLEEELAAELDRLQVDTETGEISESQEVNAQVSATDIASQSVSVSSGEVVVDPQDEDAAGADAEFCGVPPLELERRLHELLEARQEERIKELEARVERMKNRLQEKEVEVTWWKETAKVMSKQLPDPSQFLR